jgi:hypothetical protein
MARKTEAEVPETEAEAEAPEPTEAPAEEAAPAEAVDQPLLPANISSVVQESIRVELASESEGSPLGHSASLDAWTASEEG